MQPKGGGSDAQWIDLQRVLKRRQNKNEKEELFAGKRAKF